MTRDEANKLAKEAWENTTGYTNSLVSVFVALGMLKLDEPENAEEKFMGLLDVYLPREEINAFFNDVARLGLKIVEK